MQVKNGSSKRFFDSELSTMGCGKRTKHKTIDFIFSYDADQPELKPVSNLSHSYVENIATLGQIQNKCAAILAGWKSERPRMVLYRTQKRASFNMQQNTSSTRRSIKPVSVIAGAILGMSVIISPVPEGISPEAWKVFGLHFGWHFGG